MTHALTPAVAGPQADARGTPATIVALYLLFLLSGAISLIYEVAWMRLLALFLGSDVRAATVVLGVFMSGLALGGAIASAALPRLRRPIVVYGLLELAIGISAAAIPVLLDTGEENYRALYAAHAESAPWLFDSVRLGIAAAVLLVPTIAMGATLPLLIQHLGRDAGNRGRTAATLYAINVSGALIGTLVAEFLLMPLLGLSRTMTVAVVLNLLIGGCALVLGRTGATGAKRPAPALPAEPRAARPTTAPADHAVLVAMALSGMAALALEIVWMRILVQTFSGTVHAFAIMLVCFLAGIGYGSRTAATRVDRSPQPIATLGLLLLGLSTAVCLLAAFESVAAAMFAGLLWRLNAVMQGNFAAASILAQFTVAGACIAAPTVMLGATFPYAVRALGSMSSGRAAGRVYAANTAGATAGCLLAGFVLLPQLGTRLSLLATAVIFASAGLLVSVVARQAPPHWLGGRIAAAVTAAAAAAVAIALPARTVANYGMQRSTSPEIIYHGDGIAHSIHLVRNDAGAISLMINGNVEADTSLVQRRHLVLKAYLPLLLHHDPRQTAVVGLGLGFTLRAMAHFPGVDRVRLIELSPEIVAAHERLKAITGDILAHPKVALKVDDARQFMMGTAESFDLISTDPIHPRITGVGYLYTREYFETMKKRLRPGGVVVQWMPMYHISPRSFDVAFRTFAQVFPNSTFWYLRGHGLFVATTDATTLDCDRIGRAFDDPAVRADLLAIGIDSPARLFAHLLMDRPHVDAYLAATTGGINTDDNADLEYHTPFEFLGRPDDIMPGLLRHAGWNAAALMRNCSPQQRIDAQDARAQRLARVTPELAEPLQ
jgi:spermidine synthase